MKTLIAAAMLLASTSAYAAPKGEWFLIFDVWECDVHNCGEGGPPSQIFLSQRAFITRQQCLTEGPRLAALSRKPFKVAERDPSYDRIAMLYAADMAIGKVFPRCERYH